MTWVVIGIDPGLAAIMQSLVELDAVKQAQASKLSREYGVEIGSVHNAQYGTVHSYHLDVLSVAFENEG